MECPTCRQVQPSIEGARFCALCGIMFSVAGGGAPDPLAGKLIGGRYRIKKLLGAGGMGRVYSADQQMGQTTRRIALKMLLAEYAANPEVVKRFMRECSTVCELEHPNTIKFYDYGQTEDGHLYIAMEFVAGQSLAVALKQGALAPARVDWIMSQICGSLQEAHDKGFVHRDIKTDNILLGSHGGEEDFVKVLDFGIAKRSGPNVPMITQEGQVVGSPPYMSPEQFSQSTVDARSDIYQLGVVTFEALTGRLPFVANNAVGWAKQHMSAPPLPFEATKAGAAVPESMRQAVLHALAKKPTERPQSARAFYGELTIGHGRSSLLRVSGRPGPNDATVDAPAPTPSPQPEVHAPGGTLMMGPSRPAPTRLDDSADPHGPRVLPNGAQASAASGSNAPPAAPTAALGGHPSASSAPLAAHGSSHPPPAIDRAERPPPTVRHRDIVPETMRDPGSLLDDAPRRRRLVLAVALLVGSLAIGGGVAIAVQLSGSGKKPAGAPTSSTGPRTPGTTAPTSPASTSAPPPTTSPAPPIASPPTTSSPTPGPLNPCREAANAAAAGQCAIALKLRLQCPERSPDHAAAHAAFDRHCRGQP